MTLHTHAVYLLFATKFEPENKEEFEYRSLESLFDLDEREDNKQNDVDCFKHCSLLNYTSKLNYGIRNYKSELNINQGTGMIERNSHRFYCYLQYPNGYIDSCALSNPTYHKFKIQECEKSASNCHMNVSCFSKMFGTFYTNYNNKTNCIYQRGAYEASASVFRAFEKEDKSLVMMLYFCVEILIV